MKPLRMFTQSKTPTHDHSHQHEADVKLDWIKFPTRARIHGISISFGIA